MKNENDSNVIVDDDNKRRVCALSTVDNPYDPINDFRMWFVFDISKGYNSCAYLDRIARTSDELSDEENAREIERAIDEIIKYDFSNMYKKVTKFVPTTA